MEIEPRSPDYRSGSLFYIHICVKDLTTYFIRTVRYLWTKRNASSFDITSIWLIRLRPEEHTRTQYGCVTWQISWLGTQLEQRQIFLCFFSIYNQTHDICALFDSLQKLRAKNILSIYVYVLCIHKLTQLLHTDLQWILYSINSYTFLALRPPICRTFYFCRVKGDPRGGREVSAHAFYRWCHGFRSRRGLLNGMVRNPLYRNWAPPARLGR